MTELHKGFKIPENSARILKFLNYAGAIPHLVQWQSNGSLVLLRSWKQVIRAVILNISYVILPIIITVIIWIWAGITQEDIR